MGQEFSGETPPPPFPTLRDGEKIPFPEGAVATNLMEAAKESELIQDLINAKKEEKFSKDKRIMTKIPQCPPKCPTFDEVEDARLLFDTATTAYENRNKGMLSFMFKKGKEEDFELKKKTLIGMNKLFDRCNHCYTPLKPCPWRCPSLEEVLDAEAIRTDFISRVTDLPDETEAQKRIIDAEFAKYEDMDEDVIGLRNDYNLCNDGCDPGDDPNGPRVKV